MWPSSLNIFENDQNNKRMKEIFIISDEHRSLHLSWIYRLRVDKYQGEISLHRVLLSVFKIFVSIRIILWTIEGFWQSCCFGSQNEQFSRLTSVHVVHRDKNLCVKFNQMLWLMKNIDLTGDSLLSALSIQFSTTEETF